MKTILDCVSDAIRAYMTERGYHVEQTGGGCTAWSKATPSGGYVLVCADLSTDGDPFGDEWSAGEYTRDGDTIPHESDNELTNLATAEMYASGMMRERECAPWKPAGCADCERSYGPGAVCECDRANAYGCADCERSYGPGAVCRCES